MAEQYTITHQEVCIMSDIMSGGAPYVTFNAQLNGRDIEMTGKVVGIWTMGDHTEARVSVTVNGEEGFIPVKWSDLTKPL